MLEALKFLKERVYSNKSKLTNNYKKLSHASMGCVTAVDGGVCIIADGGSTDGSLDADFVKTVGVTAVLTKTGPGKLSAQLRMAYAWSIKHGYDGIVTIDGNGAETIDGQTTIDVSSQYDSLTIIAGASEWHIL